MSIISTSDEDADLKKMLLQPNGKTLCFFCGDPIFGLKPFVYWHGFTNGTIAEADLLLHAPCAVTLSAHLAKDGLLAEADFVARPRKSR